MANNETFSSLVPSIGDAPVPTGVGIASVALQLAMQYTNINTVQDGVLYQQYKLENKPMQDLSLQMVFEKALEIEKYLISRNTAVQKLLTDELMGMVERYAGESNKAHSSEYLENIEKDAVLFLAETYDHAGEGTSFYVDGVIEEVNEVRSDTYLLKVTSSLECPNNLTIDDRTIEIPEASAGDLVGKRALIYFTKRRTDVEGVFTNDVYHIEYPEADE